ncbi:putative Polyprotein [Cocos nucifera]|uniref:Putative Polyprotein n=1 Tax=Cocos nucifera TaxID=13894 RepID=A0A8K0ILW5_COCNU|nr:putative Polyprotein [Cocos nucifera]
MKPNQVEPIQSLPPPRRSERVFRPPERYLGTISEEVVGNGVLGNDPKIYNEAISNIDFEKWLEAMKSEIDSMHSNQV